MSPAPRPADFSPQTPLISCSWMPTLSAAPAERGLTASSQPVSSSYLAVPALRNHLVFPLSVRTEKYFSAEEKVSL